jgi:hypothetical protein
LFKSLLSVDRTAKFIKKGNQLAEYVTRRKLARAQGAPDILENALNPAARVRTGCKRVQPNNCTITASKFSYSIRTLLLTP